MQDSNLRDPLPLYADGRRKAENNRGWGIWGQVPVPTSRACTGNRKESRAGSLLPELQVQALLLPLRRRKETGYLKAGKARECRYQLRRRNRTERKQEKESSCNRTGTNAKRATGSGEKDGR